MDEETKIQQELQGLHDRETAKKKREKRRDNEKKQREIVRAQLNMTAPMDIGVEQSGPRGEEAMFALKALDKTDGALARIARGKMALLKAAEEAKERDSGFGLSGRDESDDEEDNLERELDSMYDQYREQKAVVDAKYRAKRARQEHGDDEWEGLSASEKENSDSEDELEEESDSDSDSDDGGTVPKRSLLTDLDNGASDDAGGLSKRARGFFSQDVFKDIPGFDDEPQEDSVEEVLAESEDPMEVEVEAEGGTQEADAPTTSGADSGTIQFGNGYSDSEDDDSVVRKDRHDDSDDKEDWEEQDKRQSSGTVGMYFRNADSKLDNTDAHARHRHHHGRGYDARALPSHRGEEEVRRGRRRLQQARVPRPRRAARLVHRRRVEARQGAAAHHQSGGGGHQGEAAGLQRAADQEGARGQGAQEAQDGDAA